ncbi:hypothetical protein EDD11_001067 [Mortierella claussenii]|nr:hypothetical protein EDD11_001067 [Mortierella claussenii]
MGDEVDKKPEAGSVEHINLKVVGQDQSEVFFKIKRSTQLKKLMDAYCDRQGKAVSSVRFLYDGDRIQPTNTPNELEMEDGDSIDVMVEQWARRKHLVDNNVKHSREPRAGESHFTERDILVENHRFLRSEEDDKDLCWEKRIAKKYYDKLFKEYALVELKYYKEGRIAMRWRNEKELFRGKGRYTCGSLACDNPDRLQSWEVNFGYVEQGEKKNALVKIRLCEECSYKLNYKKKQKRVSSDSLPPAEAPSSSSKRSKSSTSKERDRNRSRSTSDSNAVVKDEDSAKEKRDDMDTAYQNNTYRERRHHHDARVGDHATSDTLKRKRSVKSH